MSRIHRILLLACGGLVIAPLTQQADAQRPGAYLGDLTWPDAERRLRDAPLVIVPFGAGAKEHGPHLPLSADQLVLDFLLAQAVDSLPVVVAPNILHGWFPQFQDYPGTTIQDPDLFQRYALDVARSLVRHGAKRVVFLNTGVTRSTGLPLSIAARVLQIEQRVPTLVVSSDDLDTPEAHALTTQTAGTHADDIETSMILALRPDLVRMDRAVKDTRDNAPGGYPGYRPSDFVRRPGDPNNSSTGIFGDPTLATAEKGRRVLELRARQWLKALRGFSTAPLPGG